MHQTDTSGPALRYWQAIFDILPVPAFIVDVDVRIESFNAAAAQLIGPEPETVFHQRGGDALHCIQAQKNGCGHGRACQDCVIRNSVNEAINGNRTYRRTHRMELHRQGEMIAIDLLVTATPLPGTDTPQVLLLLEDVSELLTLRGLIPICAHCKKVRDDQQYWQSIETYLHKQMHLKLTHGICPSCYAEQMKELQALKQKAAQDSPAP